MNKLSENQVRDKVFVSCFDTTCTAEAGGEFTMPDYYPEIRRVVSVSASALPDSKYVSDKKLEVGGVLAFTLLYIGDDGTLSCVPYATEFSQSIPVPERFSGSNADIRIHCSAESIVCRPLAPRTVSLKAKVRSRVFADGYEDCSAKTQSINDGPVPPEARHSVERLERQINTVSRKCFSATGNVSKSEAVTPGTKPVMCYGELSVDSTTTSDESITVKGNIAVSCLALTNEGIYKTLYFNLPVEEKIGAEGVTKDHICASHGRVASVSVTADEEGSLDIDAEYDLDSVCAKELPLSLTDDVYSTAYQISVERDPVDALSLLCLQNTRAEISGEGRRRSPVGEADYVIHQSAEPKIERADIRGDKIVFSGNCNFKALIASGGDVITEEFSAPLKLEFPAQNTDGAENLIWTAHATAEKTKCSIDGQKLEGTCALSIFAEAVGESAISPVVKVSIGEKDNERDGSVIQICYPEKGRSVWSIAKDCRASISDCERINKVKRTDISDSTPLIIR